MVCEDSGSLKKKKVSFIYSSCAFSVANKLFCLFLDFYVYLQWQQARATKLLLPIQMGCKEFVWCWEDLREVPGGSYSGVPKVSTCKTATSPLTPILCKPAKCHHHHHHLLHHHQQGMTTGWQRGWQGDDDGGNDDKGRQRDKDDSEVMAGRRQWQQLTVKRQPQEMTTNDNGDGNHHHSTPNHCCEQLLVGWEQGAMGWGWWGQQETARGRRANT